MSDWEGITVVAPPNQGFTAWIISSLEATGFVPSSVDPCRWVHSSGAFADIAPVPAPLEKAE